MGIKLSIVGLSEGIETTYEEYVDIEIGKRRESPSIILV